MTMTETLGPHLPFLRRYARALTGSQPTGDTYVRVLLESLLDGNMRLPEGVPPRLGLYRLFHELWTSSIHLPGEEEASVDSSVEQRLQALQPDNREALLLTSIEDFTVAEAAYILETSEHEVQEEIDAALLSLDQNLQSRVLIIEDEAIIALDLENLVNELGHHVVGIAATRDDAVRLARQRRPELILTDIKLADGSSGVDAAMAIVADLDVPVVFITAYPEFLLTGQRPEPTYLVTKPFSRDTVRATIGQALFFHRPRMAA
ncbi:response regulator [Rhizomicrobium electricum]|jgi:CheY-like chemotaxis protein|uniref:Anti-anti sigma factor/receiver protein PhyR n=1 Tax=Rhizomicrobium electricum TaxID=480070 RepID=A0ABN1E720_9PROT|nr:response regulator [Rhizomicrobium electricum]NIJ47831.1 CheY-like chemotaxis protein [Rhizomicrobium electricum]